MPFEEKLMYNNPLNSYDAFQVIQYLINQARIENNVTKADNRKCFECCSFIGQELYDFKNINYDLLSTKDLGFQDTVHYFSIIGLNTEKGYRSFVIDPVFDQFDNEKYPNYPNVLNTKKIFCSNEQNTKFFDRMKNQRYFELTNYNITSYINGLVNIGKNMNQNISYNTILTNFYSRLNNKHFKISNENNLLIDDIELLKLLRLRLIEILKKQNLQNNETREKTR